MTINELLGISIDKPNTEVYTACKKNFDSIAKPIDGLGDFEDLICRLGAIYENERFAIDKRCAVIMCADNGIIEEGVSQCGKEVTLSVAKALSAGISSASTLGKSAGVDIVPVDIGIDSDEIIPGLRGHKISKGTRNFFKEKAMTRQQALDAIETGINLVNELTSKGYRIIITGEMGIGNTTTSAAVLSALLTEDSDQLTGRGAGLSDEGLSRKKEVIKKALSMYDFQKITEPKEKALAVLESVGGLDIAGLVGVFIGCAICHVPAVLDGVISASAAVIAGELVPGCRDYMIASHLGREAGNEKALNYLGLKPYILGNMALGEGTGAIMLMPLIDMVYDYYMGGSSFSDIAVEDYHRFS
ncbi:nicotinate-nucleotide--dimethylbenzimidazole phosphoribosyltransferase [Butyrivibrio proteoclasticus]|uniref:nicotinate-nucleotide--dimethylbenzimidazole phosphoribosyltransferase n=1 Tax=Butyrivibrio proteoclasticus TaxID=43305 RepID=UPI000478B188|nr:nicotinate-nucleotide--dimethylbenzimidazole phosphoribosyltransferase [Butyrivibrio proteoclasticus]